MLPIQGQLILIIEIIVIIIIRLQSIEHLHIAGIVLGA